MSAPLQNIYRGNTRSATKIKFKSIFTAVLITGLSVTSCALHQTVQLSVNSLDEESCISQSVTSTVHYDIKTLFLLLERG